jgi:hypothetical protein
MGQNLIKFNNVCIFTPLKIYTLEDLKCDYIINKINHAINISDFNEDAEF